MIKAVIFDMDGVIVDSEKLWHRRFYDFLESCGVHVEESSLYRLIGVKEKAPIWKEILKDKELPFDIENIMTVMNEKSLSENIKYLPVLNPNVHLLLSTLKERGIKTALASSGPPRLINRMKEECDLVDGFDFTTSGDQFKESKPNPEIFLHTAEQLEVHPEECLVIEDSPVGIQAAKAAGMYVIAKEDDTFGMDQSQANIMIQDLIQVLDIIDTL